MSSAEFRALNQQPARSRKAKHDYKADFIQQLQLAGLPAPRTEFRFARPQRQWRLDFAWVGESVAVEYQGGVYDEGKSGHTTVRGFSRDCLKFSEAAIRGWMLILITADMVRSGEALQLIERALKVRQAEKESD
jgi:hypothetical protein